jgi:REP element-mobilizing transposase RayT
MIHAYHVILPAYGFWLPNDPRGSWSDFVGRWELVRFGRTTKALSRHDLSQLSEAELAQREEARRSLKYPAVQFTGVQARSIGAGFADACRHSRYTLWACSILPEHTHVVIARHTYKVEQIVIRLKGASTRQLCHEGLHPLAGFALEGERPPRMWAEHQWKVFLDSEEAIEEAIHYVEQNPVLEGKGLQTWSFVTRFAGLPKGGHVTYY